MSKGFILALSALAVIALSGVAMAGPWVPDGFGRIGSDGSGPYFDWENGQDLNGFFGSPFLVGNTFMFTTQFLVEATNGASDQQNDIVMVDVHIHEGLQFTGLNIAVYGDYNLIGDASAHLDASVSASELGGLNRNWAGPIPTDPAFPLFGTPEGNSGVWTGDAVVDVSWVFPEPHSSLQIMLSSDLLVITGPGGSASLNAQFQSLEIEFLIIPEPATLSLVALGALALIRRR